MTEEGNVFAKESSRELVFFPGYAQCQSDPLFHQFSEPFVIGQFGPNRLEFSGGGVSRGEASLKNIADFVIRAVAARELGIFAPASRLAAHVVLPREAAGMEGAQFHQLLFDSGDSLFDLRDAIICFHSRYYMYSIGHAASHFLVVIARSFCPPVAGLLARPGTATPRLRPHFHLPVARGRFGGLVPSPRSCRRDQPGAGPGFVGSQLLLPAALLPFARVGFGTIDPALAANPPALVPAAAGAGQRAGRRAGRWPQAAQGGQKDARRQKPPSGVPLQRQGFLHHGPFPPSRRGPGPGGGRLSGRAVGGPHSRGRGLEQSRPAHFVG